MKNIKDLVLVATYCVNDNWYGKCYRVILSQSTDTGFVRKGDARKYTSQLKKYLKLKYNQKSKNLLIDCDERDQFPSYTYVANGPSQGYKHTNISVTELESWLEQN